MMRQLIAAAFLALGILGAALVVSAAVGCGDAGRHAFRLERGLISAVEHTPGGVPVEAPDEMLASDEFRVALVEIDAVADGFAAGLRPYQVTLRGIKLTQEPDDPEPHDMAVHYVGDGVIEAHLWEGHRPVVHCLVAAFAAMAREQNPGLPEWNVRSARWHATWRLMQLYPEAELGEELAEID